MSLLKNIKKNNILQPFEIVKPKVLSISRNVYYDKVGLLGVYVLWFFKKPQNLGWIEATSLAKLKLF